MNYLMFEGKRYFLTGDKEDAAHNSPSMVELATIPEGDTCKLGDKECIVLEHYCGKTLLLMKDLLADRVAFGSNNNYNDSNVDRICNEFADKLADIVGKENVLEYTVDLTSDDGLKDYGEVTRRVSLLTTEQYRKYVTILDKYKLDAWWWLATPHSTATHENAGWVKCVSPPGGVYDITHFIDNGVRPFCILKSNILVSK